MTVINLNDALEERITETENKLQTAVAVKAETKVIAALSRELTQLRNTLACNVKAEPASDEEDRQRFEDIEVLKADIRLNVLSQFDYYYVHDQERFVLFDPISNVWSYNTPRAMCNINSKLVQNSNYYNLFMDVLREDNRWFRSQTVSFNAPPHLLNRLRYTKLEPLDEPHDPLFDLVVKSMSGAKQENIDHIEKVIVAKWNRPGNFLLPVLCFSDDGATGKSLFVSAVISTLFGAEAVASNETMQNFAGQFNGHLAGKLAIMINENCEDSYNHNRMKMIAGSPRMTFCYKGQMPFEGESTALYFVTGNSIAGSIKVGGGDVDRRFSILKGTQKLSAYTAPYVSQLSGEPVTREEAEAWMQLEGQKILRDPTEVAKWLGSLVKRHGLVETVPALHGSDYQETVATQKPLTSQVFEAIFGDPTFTYVKKPLVYEFYRAETLIQGNKNSMGKGKFYPTLDAWLTKHQPHISCTKANWASSTADVYADAALITVTRPSFHPNEDRYYHENGYGRDWKVAI